MSLIIIYINSHIKWLPIILFSYDLPTDNIIKVWRLYPYAQESLAPLMSFYCAHTPIHMTVLRDKLAVAFQEHASATYTVVMYNLKGKSE